MKHILLILVIITSIYLLGCDTSTDPLVDGDIDTLETVVDGDGEPDVVEYDAELEPDLELESEPEIEGEADPEPEPEPEQEIEPLERPQGPWYQCPEEDYLGPYTLTVQAMDEEYHYYNGDSDNQRTIYVQADFPPGGSYELITMKMELTCPGRNECDHWDRYAGIFLVKDKDGENEEHIELMRYITPYKTGLCVLADVTHLAGVLKGTQTLRSQIDTWVGPNSTSGIGWEVSLTFFFHPGQPPTDAGEISMLWPNKYVHIGYPDNTIADQYPPNTMPIAADVTKAMVRLLVTGHGQGNLNNCGEFCPMVQHIIVNGTVFDWDHFRSDCDKNPIGWKQSGTWQYNRAGWCPGAISHEMVFDVTEALNIGGENTFEYAMDLRSGGTYVNSCMPGQGNENNRCTGCTFDYSDGNCDFNGGNHTSPVENISAQLILVK